LLDAGARKVIVGSALLREGRLDVEHAQSLAIAVGAPALMFAVDSRGGRVSIDGWRTGTSLTAVEMIRVLDPFCETFLYTHIDGEGLMGGIPMDVVERIHNVTQRRLVAAGGIMQQEEIDQLDAMGVDAVVGMALYTGKIAG